MSQIVAILSLFFFIFNQTGFSQEAARAVFFANRGGDGQWLTYQDNQRALYRIITDEAFKLLDERAEKVSKYGCSSHITQLICYNTSQ